MVSTFYGSDHSNVAPSVVPEEKPTPQRLNRQQQADLIAWVKVWYDAGCAVHPAKVDGSKRPVNVRHGSPDLQEAVFPATYRAGPFAGLPHPRGGQPNPEAGQYGYGWARIATGDLPRLTPAQVASYIRAGKADGIGVICGLPSGGLFMLEAEGRARELLPKVKEAAAAAGCLHLLERLAGGCVDESPSGGLHFYARSDDGVVPGNDVLAARPAGGIVEVLFETRGQGGWSAVAPSAGRTHKSGKSYSFLRGGPSTIPTFSHDELRQLFDVFRAVDERPKPETASARPTVVERRERPAGDVLPGDDFNERATWEEILSPAGWTRQQVVGDRQHWVRPGKAHGTSATTTADVLCCYSSSAGLPVFSGRGSKNALSKFATYAHLNHGGDFTAAARALWELGYGSRDRDDSDGGQPVPVEQRPTPAGPCRSLAEWRAESAESRAAAVSQPGLHLDTSATGSGKTFATNAALARASSSLTVLPSHANCEERVQELREHGVDAVAYPELSPATCQKYDVASRVQSLGLVAGATVCISCEFQKTCAYQAGCKAAQKAKHRVATHERLRRSSTPADGVQVVVVDEMPETVLAPTLHVSSKQVAAVGLLAHGIKHHWYSTANVDQKSFAGTLLAVVDAIRQTCADITTPGRQPVTLPAGRDVPDNWQRLLYESIQSVGVASSMDAEALTLVTRAAAGELVSLEIVTDLTRAGRLHHYVVGSWRPALPADAAVVMLDATGDADDIAAVLGKPVNNTTPAGHLPVVQQVVQIPDDISRSTSSATVAGCVEAFLKAHPEVQRLGIIGHKPHVVDLIENGGLSEPARVRVAKSCWFGGGPDRASNDWHRECDHLLVLGTPRANPGDYRRWLAQHGLHAAAGKVDGDWGPRHWQAITVDGRAVTVDGAGYRDGDWHRAYQAVSRSTLQQSVGRCRPVLPDGIPATILSNEPTPYPVAPSLIVTPAAARETAEIVRNMGKAAPLPSASRSAKSAIENPYSENCTSGVYQTGDVLQAVMAAAGIDRRAAYGRLRQCKEAGLLFQPAGRRGWWALPESADAPIPALPTRQPPAAVVPPAIISPPVQAVVISATGPTGPAPAVDVVADCPAVVTTTTTTSTVQQADAPAYDDLLALIDERAAIMEYDGGLDRATADRLARETMLGRDVQAAPPDVAQPPDVVAVDMPSLNASLHPFVNRVRQHFPGNVRLIDDRGDPFATSWRSSKQDRPPGVCQCGHDDWVQVPIHGGKSVRVDCRHCDRFGWFGVWHGRRLRGPTDPPDAPTASEPVQETDTLSFGFLTLPTGPMTVPAG